VLVAGEIALALVLLVGAGLTVRSFVRVQQVTTGFNPDRVLTLTVSPPPNRYGTQPARAEYWEKVLTGLQRIPNVEAVAQSAACLCFPATVLAALAFRPRHQRAGAGALPNRVARLLQGDGHTDAPRPAPSFANDREDHPAVAIISQAAAQRYWPDRDPSV
jgi:hypothetical protein